MRDREQQEAEREKADRRAAVAEKAKEIEQFKLQIAADREAAKMADAQREAEKEKRKADALTALNAPAPKATEPAERIQ